MRAINRRISALIFVGVVSFLPTASHSDEREDATAAAKTVIAALAEKKFPQIWDTLASDRYKNDMGFTRQLFTVGLEIARRQIGRLTSSTVLYVRYDAPHPTWAFKGKSYVVIFENVYTTGARQEGVVVIEEDGQFKMAGLGIGSAGR